MDCQGLASEVPIAMIRQRTRDDFNEVILDCYFGQMNKRSDERHQMKEPYIHFHWREVLAESRILA